MVSGMTGPRSIWPGPSWPWGSMSKCRTTSAALTAVAGAAALGVEGVEAFGREADEPVGPRHRRAPGAGASASAGSVSSRPLRSRNSASRPATRPARKTAPSSAGRQNSPRVQPSRLSRTRHTRSGSGRSALPSGCSGSDRNSRSSWEINNVGATAATSASRTAGTRRAMRTMASSVNRPAANRPKHSGSSSTRRAMRTSPSARPCETPAFHDTQCSGDRIPAPTQPSTSSSETTAPTSRATPALTAPMTSTAVASAARHATSCGPGCGGPSPEGAGGSSVTDMHQPYRGGMTLKGAEVRTSSGGRLATRRPARRDRGLLTTPLDPGPRSGP